MTTACPAPHHSFIRHFLSNAWVVLVFVVASLLLGVCGYHYLEGMPWIDALLNASMIAGGMGPVDILHTWEGKIFASFYAIYSGLFLIGATGFLLVPVFHRVMHNLNQK